MRLHDRQIDALTRDGFIVNPLLTSAEAERARDGAFQHVAPPFALRHQARMGHDFFPWDDDGLNHAATHPDLIDACARILGTRAIQLLTGFVWVKYADVDYGAGFHIDYANNTLGPELVRDDFGHITVLIYLDDVDDALAPVLMVPNGRPDDQATPITGPAGTACIYSIFTRHSASAFRRAGHRVAMWVTVGRKDRPWDAAHRFGAHTAAHQSGMRRYIASATPRQLEFIGFPPVGDPLWSPAFLDGMCARYPGFDAGRYHRGGDEPGR